MLIEQTESKRKPLCKFKKAKNKCVDIMQDRRKLRRLRKVCRKKKDTCDKMKIRQIKQKPRRCERKGGICQINLDGKKPRCFCHITFDV